MPLRASPRPGPRPPPRGTPPHWNGAKKEKEGGGGGGRRYGKHTTAKKRGGSLPRVAVPPHRNEPQRCRTVPHRLDGTRPVRGATTKTRAQPPTTAAVAATTACAVGGRWTAAESRVPRAGRWRMRRPPPHAAQTARCWLPRARPHPHPPHRPARHHHGHRAFSRAAKGPGRHVDGERRWWGGASPARLRNSRSERRRAATLYAPDTLTMGATNAWRETYWVFLENFGRIQWRLHNWRRNRPPDRVVQPKRWGEEASRSWRSPLIRAMHWGCVRGSTILIWTVLAARAWSC